MPIYEYQCHNCGNEFEQIQGWADGAPSCAACGSENVTRRLSPPAIHFKGSGWYITDSKNGKGKNGANGVAGTNGASKDGEGAKESASDSAAEKSTAEAKGDSASKTDSSKQESGKVKTAS